MKKPAFKIVTPAMTFEVTTLQMRRFLSLAGRELGELSKERGLNQTEKEVAGLIDLIRSQSSELR